MNPLETIGNLLPKETIGKAYDDALSGPAQQLGKFGTDALKTARLILAPLQIAAAFQDRLEKMCERTASACRRKDELSLRRRSLARRWSG